MLAFVNTSCYNDRFLIIYNVDSEFWPCESVCNCFPVQRLNCGIWPLDPATPVSAWTAKTAIRNAYEYWPWYRDRTSKSFRSQSVNTEKCVFPCCFIKKNFWGYIPKPRPRYKVWGWKYWWRSLSDQSEKETKQILYKE